MDKTYENKFASTIIKRQGASSGSLRVFDWRESENNPFLTLFIEIETSDKENEKIIITLAEVLADQFFNAPTATVEFAFESALAKANISVKDALLIKPKSWLNKIHILVAAGRGQELHLSSVGRAHAFLAHRDQIMDVVAGQNENSRGGLNAARTPNPVKLFSNIVSGRLLGQDALVICNESVLDYLSPERIRKTAQEFGADTATAKFEELLAAAPANKQFCLAVIKRAAAPVAPAPKEQIIVAEAASEETMVEKYLRPESPRRINRREAGIQAKIMAATANAGKSAIKITAHYSQIGLAATLSGLSKSLEIIQGKLSTAVPRVGRAPKFLFTLWKDEEARVYHLTRAKANWQNKLAKIQAYFNGLSPKQKRVLLTTLALAFIFITSIAWRAYDKSAAESKVIYENNLGAIAQKIDQAEASLIYRDEARSRELLNEITALLAAMAENSNANQAGYEEFKTKAANIQNTLDKKQVLGELSLWLAAAADNIVKIESDYFVYGMESKKISKLDFASSSLIDIPAKTELKPFAQAVAYDSNNIALIGAGTVDLLNIKTGEVSSKNLTPSPAPSRAWASYARNLYALTPADGSIVRYKENELGSPQPWLKETVDLSKGFDLMVDGQIYVLTDSAIVILAAGRPAANIALGISKKLGENSRFAMDNSLNSLFILDGEHERLLHFSKKGDLYNQYLSPSLKNARAMAVSADEKYAYILNGDKIYRIEILPPA